jgi:hypothetical protein
MKMILGALAASAVLAVAAAPASAETDLDAIVEEVTELAGVDVVKLVKRRGYAPRYLEEDDVYAPRYFEHDLGKLPVGSAEWWRQYDRERGGRR